MKKELKKADILALSEYEKVRDVRMEDIMRLKHSRRVFVGPFAMFLFENYDTLWWQIHEILRISQGGDELIEEGLASYASLVPQGQELVATFIMEIGDPKERQKVLPQLNGIDHMIKIKFEGEEVMATPAEGGKWSSEDEEIPTLHFLHFKMSPDQAEKFKNTDHPAVIDIFHPDYVYEMELPPEVHESLKGDLA